MAQVDRIFAEYQLNAGEFTFDENVAAVFDDMISRSVPLYADVQRSIPVLAELLDHDPLRIVDLGCSTGTSLIHIAKNLSSRNVELIGVDNSEAMLAKCQEKLTRLGLADEIQTQFGQIQDFEFSNASIVLMNYTLQFIDADQRASVLRSIFDSMRDGGFLLISEKVVDPDQRINDAMVDLYFEFKRRQGYSELEISRKRDALENVLVPLTIKKNVQLIESAGFARVEILLKWFNFATFVCYRND